MKSFLFKCIFFLTLTWSLANTTAPCIECGSPCDEKTICPQSCPLCINEKCTPTSVSSSLVLISSFGFLCALILLGKGLRALIKPLQWLYLPSSVIGGCIGLLFVQLSRLDHNFHQYVIHEWVVFWEPLPGFLINLVFAGLFIGKRLPGLNRVWKKAGHQFLYGQAVAWGQFAVGLGITAALLIPVFNVHPLFGATLPVGFEGGHGTAAGLASSFAKLGWEDGEDVGYIIATIGIISGIVIGMAMIPIARKLGLVHDVLPRGANVSMLMRGIYPNSEERPSAGIQTVSPDSIDVLSLHVGVAGLGLLFGYGVKRLFMYLETFSPLLTKYHFLSGFPLFPLCMIGGIIIQQILVLAKMDYLLDGEVMQRVIGIALDFLVVAAITMIDLTAVTSYIGPVIIIAVTGVFWQLFMFLVCSRFLFPDFWVERGIVELGKTMGVTATGLLLLRVVDPHNKTQVLDDFSLKLLFHEPTFGGIWMGLSLSLISLIGIWPVFGICSAITLFWLSVGFILWWKHRKKKRAADKTQPVEQESVPIEESNAIPMSEVENPCTEDTSLKNSKQDRV